MLFNSYIFIYAFMPVVLIVFFALGRKTPTLAQVWLVLASLVFYGWWKPAFVLLLVGSVCVNYALGVALIRTGRRVVQKALVAAGVTANLALLAYFKYAGFLLANINSVAGTHWSLGDIVLPVGISFYTFTSIAYIVEVYQGKVRETDFVRYALFITYFPHLVAGPVIYHNEVIPKFGEAATYRFDSGRVAVGLTMFFIGLFKKVIFADGISHALADRSLEPAFWKAEHGLPVTFVDGWAGALGYSLQLYYDFSGYSDMALGLSLLFGVKLPMNFHSPYKAANIIDFWRRWHMSLGRWLRNYLYIPLGGNRRGPVRRQMNLFITMTLCGLWHGAGWTFVAWGALHGVYIVVNHGVRAVRQALGLVRPSVLGRASARALTLLTVVVGWVIFRANDLRAAGGVLKGMAGLNGVVLSQADQLLLWQLGPWLGAHGVRFERLFYTSVWTAFWWIAPLSAIALFAPNTQEILGRFDPAIDTFGAHERLSAPAWLTWSPNRRWAAVVAVLVVASIVSLRSGATEFLYFRF